MISNKQAGERKREREKREFKGPVRRHTHIVYTVLVLRKLN
jgi:hypothetical protein